MLEAGHVFTLHSLHASTLTTQRVVLFLISSTLYACHHSPHTVRYRHPFLSLPLLPCTRILLGKQTPALRLSSSTTPDRRCFAIEVEGGGVVELEAPGSGDVKYWLRGLWEVAVGVWGMEVGRTLSFVGKEEVGREVLDRVERRLRRGRMDGQWARRREEGDRRMDAAGRLLRGKQGEERAKEEADVAKREEWAALQREAEQRVMAAASSSLRGVHEEGQRHAVCERMEREVSAQRVAEVARRSEAAAAAAAVSPPSASFAPARADHNKRTASLQTHTTQPLLSASPQWQGTAADKGGRSMRPGHLHLPPSRSFPTLPASASGPPSPSRSTATTSSSSSSRTASPSCHLRRLGSILPSSTTSSSSSVSSRSVSPDPAIVPTTPSTPSPSSATSASPVQPVHPTPADSALPLPPYTRASTTPVGRTMSVAYPLPAVSASPASLPSASPWTSRAMMRPPPFLAALAVARVCAVHTPALVLPASYAQAKQPPPMPTQLTSPTPMDPLSPPSLMSPSSSSSSSSSPTSIDIHCHLNLSQSRQPLSSHPPHIHFHLHTSTTGSTTGTITGTTTADPSSSTPTILPPSYSSHTFQPSGLPTFLTSPTRR